MFRLAQYAIRGSHQAIKKPFLYTNVRMYLSDSYQAFDKWDESLSTEILQKTNISELLIDVEDKLIRKKYVSSLDIEILAAKLTNVETTEDLKLAETILEKFRRTSEALEFQPSLAYSLVRNYLDLGQKERLLPILQDKVKYGIFLDRFSANLLLNSFLLEKKYKEATQVCTHLMLQDEGDDRLTRALGLNACYNFYLTATDEDFKNVQEEEDDEDIVKVKVNFVRNHTNDDHFDLIDKRKLLGKTTAYLGREGNNSSIISLQILGNILYKKFGRICDTLQTILDNNELQLDETIAKTLEKELDEYVYDPLEAKERLPQSPYRRLELIPEAARDIIKEKLLPQLRQRNKIVALDLKEFVEKNLIEIAALADKHDTKKHEEQITIWTRERQEQFDDQIHRFVIEQKKLNLLERLRLLEERDELLSFFENESRIVMHSQDKTFADESFENVRTSGEHEYFELARQHYHWNRMEPRRSLHLDKKLRDEEMSDIRNWPPYEYLAENWKYSLLDYVPLDEKMKRRKESLPPSGKPPYYKQHFF
ncbi:unnamed protein product [Rotaria magnacalcarata]|uniref:Mitochondrial 28S ribosomal protein S27 n=10 Tax=Rotaria magnacalcarata TaxID=392030 RepID=A0A814Z634_9BILA|nr:unnamed protein product [Rotaria magnacalcarata]CAF1651287.1 unnamed protein product [Rotaria magnacalcarata]